ncbi:MAG: hypothetical protein NUV91_01620, partial [Candidatus Omnitrophica bacterium]|nr:hypothetical protein [Candidatus Omnitrophota bacterium]
IYSFVFMIFVEVFFNILPAMSTGLALKLKKFFVFFRRLLPGDPIDPAWPREGYSANDVVAQFQSVVAYHNGDRPVVGGGFQRLSANPNEMPPAIARALQEIRENDDHFHYELISLLIDWGHIYYGESDVFYGANNFTGRLQRSTVYLISTNVDPSRGDPSLAEILIHEIHRGLHEDNQLAADKYLLSTEGIARRSTIDRLLNHLEMTDQALWSLSQAIAERMQQNPQMVFEMLRTLILGREIRQQHGLAAQILRATHREISRQAHLPVGTEEEAPWEMVVHFSGSGKDVARDYSDQLTKLTRAFYLEWKREPRPHQNPLLRSFYQVSAQYSAQAFSPSESTNGVSWTLATVMKELLDNAFESYASSLMEGPIRLRIFEEGKNLVITISDNGRGIDFEKTGYDVHGIWRVVSLPVDLHGQAPRLHLGGKHIAVEYSRLLIADLEGSLEHLPANEEGYRTTVRITLPRSVVRFMKFEEGNGKAIPRKGASHQHAIDLHSPKWVSGVVLAAALGSTSLGMEMAEGLFIGLAWAVFLFLSWISRAAFFTNAPWIGAAHNLPASDRIDTQMIFEAEMDVTDDDLTSGNKRAEKRNRLFEILKMSWLTEPSAEVIRKHFAIWELFRGGYDLIPKRAAKNFLAPETISWVVMDELIKNAFDAYISDERPGKILVRIHRDGKYLFVDILDDGIGLDFKRTKRYGDVGIWTLVPHHLPSSRLEKDGGAHIGVLWSQIVVRLHGGDLEYAPATEYGYRTRTRILLPIEAVNVELVQPERQFSGIRAFYPNSPLKETVSIDGAYLSSRQPVLRQPHDPAWPREGYQAGDVIEELRRLVEQDEDGKVLGVRGFRRVESLEEPEFVRELADYTRRHDSVLYGQLVASVNAGELYYGENNQVFWGANGFFYKRLSTGSPKDQEQRIFVVTTNGNPQDGDPTPVEIALHEFTGQSHEGGMHVVDVFRTINRPLSEEEQRQGGRTRFERSVEFDHNDLMNRQGRAEKRSELLQGLGLRWFRSPRGSDPRRFHILSHQMIGGYERANPWIFSTGLANSQREEFLREAIASSITKFMEELLKNAFDAYVAAQKTGIVLLRIYETPEELVIEISDNGIGVDLSRTGFNGNGEWCVYSLPRADNGSVVRYQREGGRKVGAVWAQFLAFLHGGKVEYFADVVEGFRTTVRASFPRREIVIKEQARDLLDDRQVSESLAKKEPHDPARRVPGQPMPSEEKVRATMENFDVGAFGILQPHTYLEAKLAPAYLRRRGEEKEAEELEALIRAGRLRAGPFTGFLGTAIIVIDGQRTILISNAEATHQSLAERVVTIIHEFRALQGRPHSDNEAEEPEVLRWLEDRRMGVEAPWDIFEQARGLVKISLQYRLRGNSFFGRDFQRDIYGNTEVNRVFETLQNRVYARAKDAMASNPLADNAFLPLLVLIDLSDTPQEKFEAFLSHGLSHYAKRFPSLGTLEQDKVIQSDLLMIAGRIHASFEEKLRAFFESGNRVLQSQSDPSAHRERKIDYDVVNSALNEFLLLWNLYVLIGFQSDWVGDRLQLKSFQVVREKERIVEGAKIDVLYLDGIDDLPAPGVLGLHDGKHTVVFVGVIREEQLPYIRRQLDQVRTPFLLSQLPVLGRWTSLDYYELEKFLIAQDFYGLSDEGIVNKVAEMIEEHEVRHSLDQQRYSFSVETLEERAFLAEVASSATHYAVSAGGRKMLRWGGSQDQDNLYSTAVHQGSRKLVTGAQRKGWVEAPNELEAAFILRRAHHQGIAIIKYTLARLIPDGRLAQLAHEILDHEEWPQEATSDESHTVLSPSERGFVPVEVSGFISRLIQGDEELRAVQSQPDADRWIFFERLTLRPRVQGERTTLRVFIMPGKPISALNPDLGEVGDEVQVVYEFVEIGTPSEGQNVILSFYRGDKPINHEPLDVRRIIVSAEGQVAIPQEARTILQRNELVLYLAGRQKEIPANMVVDLIEQQQETESTMMVTLAPGIRLYGLPSSLGSPAKEKAGLPADQVIVRFARKDRKEKILMASVFPAAAPATEPAHAIREIEFGKKESRRSPNKRGADELHQIRAFEAETGLVYADLPDEVRAVVPAFVRARGRVFLESGESVRVDWLTMSEEDIRQRLDEERGEALFLELYGPIPDMSVARAFSHASLYARIQILETHDVPFMDVYWSIIFKGTAELILSKIPYLRFLHFVLHLYGLNEQQTQEWIRENEATFLVSSEDKRLNQLGRALDAYLGHVVRQPTSEEMDDLKTYRQRSTAGARENHLRQNLHRRIRGERDGALYTQRSRLIQIYQNYLKTRDVGTALRDLASLRLAVTNADVSLEAARLRGILNDIQQGLAFKVEALSFTRVARSIRARMMIREKKWSSSRRTAPLLPAQNLLEIMTARELEKRIREWIETFSGREDEAQEALENKFQEELLEIAFYLLGKTANGSFVSYEEILDAIDGFVLTSTRELKKAIGLLTYQGFKFRWHNGGRSFRNGIEVLEAPWHLEHARQQNVQSQRARREVSQVLSGFSTEERQFQRQWDEAMAAAHARLASSTNTLPLTCDFWRWVSRLVSRALIWIFTLGRVRAQWTMPDWMISVLAAFTPWEWVAAFFQEFVNWHGPQTERQKKWREAGHIFIIAATGIAALFSLGVLSIGYSISMPILVWLVVRNAFIANAVAHLIYNIIALLFFSDGVLTLGLAPKREPRHPLSRFIVGLAPIIESHEVTLVKTTNPETRLVVYSEFKVAGLSADLGPVNGKAAAHYHVRPTREDGVREVDVMFVKVGEEAEAVDSKNSRRLFIKEEEGSRGIKQRNVTVRPIGTFSDLMKIYREGLSDEFPAEGLLHARLRPRGDLWLTQFAGAQVYALPASFENGDEVALKLSSVGEGTRDLWLELRPVHAPVNEPAHVKVWLQYPGDDTVTVLDDRRSANHLHEERALMVEAGIDYSQIAGEKTAPGVMLEKVRVFRRYGRPVVMSWLRPDMTAIAIENRLAVSGEREVLSFDQADPTLRRHKEREVRLFLSKYGRVPKDVRKTINKWEIYARIRYAFENHGVPFHSIYWSRIFEQNAKDLLAGIPYLRFLHFVLRLYGLKEENERISLIESDIQYFVKGGARYFLQNFVEALGELLDWKISVPLPVLLDLRRERGSWSAKALRQVVERHKGEESYPEVGRQLRTLLEIYRFYLEDQGERLEETRRRLKLLQNEDLTPLVIRQEISGLLILLNEISKGPQWRAKELNVERPLFTTQINLLNLMDPVELTRLLDSLEEDGMGRRDARRTLLEVQANEVRDVGMYLTRLGRHQFVAYEKILDNLDALLIEAVETLRLALGFLSHDGFQFRYVAACDDHPAGIVIKDISRSFEKLVEAEDRVIAETHLRQKQARAQAVHDGKAHPKGGVRRGALRVDSTYNMAVKILQALGLGRYVKTRLGRLFIFFFTLPWELFPSLRSDFLKRHDPQTSEQHKIRRAGIRAIRWWTVMGFVLGGIWTLLASSITWQIGALSYIFIFLTIKSCIDLAGFPISDFFDANSDRRAPVEIGLRARVIILGFLVLWQYKELAFLLPIILPALIGGALLNMIRHAMHNTR